MLIGKKGQALPGHKPTPSPFRYRLSCSNSKSGAVCKGLSSPSVPMPMTTSPACPTTVSAGASYFFIRIHLLSVLFCSFKLVVSGDSALAHSQAVLRAVAQPQFEQDDLSQLGLIAVEPSGKPLQARAHAGALYKSALH